MSFPYSRFSYRWWCEALTAILNHHSTTAPYSSSIPVNICAPACGRSIPDEVIEAIVTGRDENRLTDYLCTDVTQTFIDGVQEVGLHIRSLPRRGLIAFTPLVPSLSTPYPQSGARFPRSLTTAPEEMFEHFVPYMLLPRFASEISADPTLLQPTGNSAVRRRVR